MHSFTSWNHNLDGGHPLPSPPCLHLAETLVILAPCTAKEQSQDGECPSPQKHQMKLPSVCAPLTQPESRAARGAMDSRGLVWSQQQKIPRFCWLVYYYNMPQAHSYSIWQKKKKTKTPLANHRTTVGCFLEHLSVRRSKGMLPSEFTWEFAPTSASQQTEENQNPTLRIHVTCIWKMKGSQAGLYHHPGCFPLDTFQLVNVQKTWLPNGLICTEDLLPVLIPPWLFWVKLFSLNVK